MTLPANRSPSDPSQTIATDYERRLAEDLRWAFREGSLHLRGEGAVQETLRRIARRLDELGIEYAVAGDMALFSHGLRRFTENVDIIVFKDDLARIHQSLTGRGYRPPFEKSKNLRDTESGVRIEFLIAGQFPGDGRPKPVAFPFPDNVTVEKNGIRFLNLSTLIELKLASGMTSPERLKDLSDVQELIRLFSLKPEFADGLNPFVRGKFLELRNNVFGVRKRYALPFRTDGRSTGIRSIQDLAAAFPDAPVDLDAMRRDGVTVDPEFGHAEQDYVYLVTEDPEVASKYDMHEESEYFDPGTDPLPGDMPE